MDFLKLAMERYSVRSFKKEPLEKDITDKILEAGLCAPTGCNNQPIRILVLNTEKSTDTLKKCTNSHFDAPVAMLVCYNKEESWVRRFDGALCAPYDAAIVTTHMMLMAQSLGVGSCWVMSFNPDALKKEYNIPTSCEPAALLVLGYAAEDSEPSPMHSKSKSMKDVVSYETF